MLEQYISPLINDYCDRLTHEPPRLLHELKEETYAHTSKPRMFSGHVEGRLLKMLVQLLQARCVLEIGTFTGGSALSMAEGLPEDGKLITCDVDKKNTQIALKYFARSPHGHKITLKLGDALKTIKNLDMIFDLVFIDADKENYKNYYEACLPRLRRGGLIVFDNSLWGGLVLNPPPGDLESQTIAQVNELVARDERVENVLLSVRDGMNIVRKL